LRSGNVHGLCIDFVHPKLTWLLHA